MYKYLIIIDLQNDFCDGVFKNEAVKKMIPNLCQYLKTKGHEYTNIVLTQDTHSTDKYNEPFPIHCIKNSEGWKIIKPLWHCLVKYERLRRKMKMIEKDKYAVDETEWNKFINVPENEKFEIDLVGTATEYCIYENYNVLKNKYPNANISVISEFCVGLDFNQSFKCLNEMNKKYIYNSEMIYNQLINFIKSKFDNDFKNCRKAIVGVSGGKDSSVVLTLLVKALGKENVIPVLLPNGEQKDIADSYEICEFNGFMKNEIINYNIYSIVNSMKSEFETNGFENVDKCGRYKTNTPARIRMTILYGIAALKGGVVANTCNLSEDYVGYSTKFGDSAGDFSLLNHLTVAEVIRLGEFMEIPDKLIHKIPDDGMCGKSDEDNLGFSYSMLDMYIRNQCLINNEMKKKIDEMHNSGITKSKLCLIPRNMSFRAKLF